MSWWVIIAALGAHAVGLILGYSIVYFIGKAIMKCDERKANKKSKVLGEQVD